MFCGYICTLGICFYVSSTCRYFVIHVSRAVLFLSDANRGGGMKKKRNSTTSLFLITGQRGAIGVGGKRQKHVMPFTKEPFYKDFLISMLSLCA